MSCERGKMALSLKMPDTISHTEYCSHPLLVKRITGTDPRNDETAWRRFYELTDYDFFWYTNDGPPWQGRTTSMGHAEFEQDGADYSDSVYCPFTSAEEVLTFDPATEYGIPDINGRAALFENGYTDMQRKYPSLVLPGGYYKTLFSACIEAFGWEMFLLGAGTAPATFSPSATTFRITSRWKTPCITSS